jgi:hypothetical protein
MSPREPGPAGLAVRRWPSGGGRYGVVSTALNRKDATAPFASSGAFELPLHWPFFGPDWYYRAITVVFATATALAAMRWRQDYYLFLIGAVAFTAATIGYQHRRRHRPGDTGHIAGMGIAYVAMLTAFYVDNGPHLPLWDRLPAFTFWLLPTVIGAPIITRAVIRARAHQARLPATGRSGWPTRSPRPGPPGSPTSGSGPVPPRPGPRT